MENDLSILLKRDYSHAGPGILTFAKSGLQLQDIDINSAVDRDTLTARARICTSRMDREGDVIEPSGVNWDDYKFCPSVLFDHGFSGIPFPIAKSEDEAGNCTVTYDVDEDAIYAVSHFSDKSELSYQMFGLIDSGLLRATSIHVDPVEGAVRAHAEGRFHCLQSNMLEWSWCTVGQNPDSYKKSLGAEKFSEALHLQLEAANQILKRGTIGNARLIPSLAKCLRAIQPPRENIVQGHTFSGDDMGTKSLSQEQIKKLSPGALAKALSEVNQWDAATVKGLRSFAKSMPDDGSLMKADLPEDSVPTEDAPAADAASAPADDSLPKSEVTEAPDAGSQLPMGAQFLTAFHSNLLSLLENADGEGARVENPAVKDGVGPIIDDLRSKIAELEGLFGSVYPDQSPLAGATEAPEDSELAKSWLAQSRSQFQLSGLAQRLSGVIDGRIDGPKAKSVLTNTVRDLHLLTRQAKSFKPAAPKDMVPKSEFDTLKKAHDADREKLKKLVNKMKGEEAPLS